MEFENVLKSDFMDTQFYIMFYLIVFLFGICIGSFLNVVILRVPEGESLIKRSSHCMTCEAKIRAIDLIPVFSWIFLKGKCHSCGKKISVRYPIVESLNGFLYMLVFWVMDFNTESIITCVMFSLLIVTGFIDWDRLEMEPIILAIIFILSIPSAIFTDSLTLTERVIGALCISVPFFIIGEVYRIFRKKYYNEDIRGIELGDTLLMFAAGAVIGTQAIIVSAFFGIIIAALCGLIIKKISGESKFAFGPYLAIGIAIGTLWGENIAQWYIQLLTAEY
ncbi:MAG: prepilin peptidase [Oscillospiraceae bacterium]|nr:prepilin peptidase [Oscillospiraceae bacterium]